MHHRTTLALVLAALAAGATTATAAIPPVIGPSGVPEFVTPIEVLIMRPNTGLTVIGPATPYSQIKLPGVPEVIGPTGPTGPAADIRSGKLQTILDITIGPYGWTHPDPHTWHRVFAGNIANDWRTADERHWTTGLGPDGMNVSPPPARPGLRPAGDPAWPVATPSPFAPPAPRVWQPTRPPSG
jgi:hypothetical protein